MFQFLTKDMLESPFSYTERGVPGHPRIPQNVSLLYANDFIHLAPPASAMHISYMDLPFHYS